MNHSTSVPLLVRALRFEPIPRPPVWLMRQAGRYMAEYRALKEQHSFLKLCQTPELACEVTMQPIDAFDPDAAILFADILLPLESMGLTIDFAPGPKVFNPIRTRKDVEALSDRAHGLDYVGESLRLIRAGLVARAQGGERKALLGFAGAPWTMACYAIDQTPYKHFEASQIMANREPETLKLLLEKLAAVTTDYLVMQFEAGADAVQLFDSWAGNLSLADYERFALPYTQQIFAELRRRGCLTMLYANGAGHLLSAMAKSGADGISVDSRMPLATAEQIVGEGIVLQGNLDPTALFAPEKELRDTTKRMLHELKRRSGYIANLGHGVLQHTPPEQVKRFIECVKEGW